MMRSAWLWLSCAAVLWAAACGDDDSAAPDQSRAQDGGSDSAKDAGSASSGHGGAGKDGGSGAQDGSNSTFTLGDAGMRVADCSESDDGTACGPNGGLSCLMQMCIASRCGDGLFDPTREECDDGNTDSGDGCEQDCTFTCDNDAMCDDGLTCNGTEHCLLSHTCALGSPAADGATCSNATVSSGECRSGTCSPVGCGDGEVKGDEQCDDGNDVSGDGCDIDCTFSCEHDADCDDGSVCTGSERCDTSTHTCLAGDPLACKDDSDCTHDTCDPVIGCVFVLIDEDGDGHAPDSLKCGDDCDDHRADVHPAHPELCDSVDHDCDGDPVPPNTPTWYVDCDDDGYAALGAENEQSCDAPAPTSCGGSWTLRFPDENDPATFDCNDADRDAHPGQSGWFVEPAAGGGYDYNCNKMTDYLYPSTTVGVTTTKCTSLLGSCTGAKGWVEDKMPKCKGTGTYTQCVSSRDLCLRSTMTVTQQCH